LEKVREKLINCQKKQAIEAIKLAREVDDIKTKFRRAG
jgi:hypothetical protein